MTNGTNTLNFGVFQDASHTLSWGNVAGTDTKSYTGTGKSGTVTIYGLIPAGQTPVPGSYTDRSIVYAVNTLYATPAVTATVPPFCTISASPLNFGTYGGAQLDVNSTLTVTCTNSTPYYVNLNDGLHVGAAFQTRAGGPGGGFLSYTLYRESGRTSRWGNSYNVDGVAGTGSGSAQILTVYGQIPAGQYVQPGAYSDTVIATITY